MSARDACCSTMAFRSTSRCCSGVPVPARLRRARPALRGVAGASTDADVAAVPGRRPGALVGVSPDHYGAPRALATRRLYSVQHALDEAVIERLARTRWHDRFATVDVPRAKPTPLA